MGVRLKIDMGKLILLVLLANLCALKCEEEKVEANVEQPTTGNPNYSFSYGVSDAKTGDVKSVWEEKDGDTVKGHYSVLDPDGSLRTVEYSSNPKTGFTAVVNSDGDKLHLEQQTTQPDNNIVVPNDGRAFMEDKAMRDYAKYYDFSEDGDLDFLTERKRPKPPTDPGFKKYSKKRGKYPSDLEASDFSHSITIKHPRDGAVAESEAHSHAHFGLDIDPNCKHKHHKKIPNNLYTNVIEFDPTKPQDVKYPFLSDPFRDTYEKFEPSTVNFKKVASPYSFGSRLPEVDPIEYEKLLVGSKLPSYEEFNYKPNTYKYKFPTIPDAPISDSYYPEDLPSRPKKKKPYKKPEYIQYAEDADEYVVHKKKRKHPPRVVEQHEYLHDSDDEYDTPRYPMDFEEEEDERPHRRPPKGTGPKEVVKKVIKKKKPTFNLLDIWDI